MGVAALMISGVTLVAPAVSPGATGIASAQAQACPDVEVVFARGTGEPDGVGRVGEAFVKALRPMFPAIGRPYTPCTTRRTGTSCGPPTVRTMPACSSRAPPRPARTPRSCSADIRRALPSSTSSPSPPRRSWGSISPCRPPSPTMSSAVAVFGNPSIRLLGAPLTALSPLYGYKTIDLCNGADPVCSCGNDVPAHSVYTRPD